MYAQKGHPGRDGPFYLSVPCGVPPALTGLRRWRRVRSRANRSGVPEPATRLPRHLARSPWLTQRHTPALGARNEPSGISGLLRRCWRSKYPRLRPGSGFGFGLGAFFVSLFPLSLFPMGPSMTQKPAAESPAALSGFAIAGRWACRSPSPGLEWLLST